MRSLPRPGILLLVCAVASACSENPTQKESAVSVVEISSLDSSMAVRESLQLTASAFGAGGKVLPGKPTTWTVSNATIAQVSATGVVTGRAPGSVTVSAEIDGVSGSLALAVDTAQMDDVVFGSDVPATARGAVVVLLSPIDSAAVSSGVRVPLDSAATPVFAVNNAGQAVLSTLSRGQGTSLEISVRSTARTMVETVLLSPMTGASDALVRTLDPAIEAHPRFAELAAAVSAKASTGTSYLDSDPALTLAAAIAVDVAREHIPVPAQLQVDSDVLPVTVVDAAGTDYILRNRTFLPFAVTAYHNANGTKFGETVLPEREIHLDEFPWKFGGDTETSLAGEDGEVRLEIGQNAETRQRRVVKAVSDVIGGIHTLLGLSVPSGSTSFAVQLVGNATPEQALAIAEAPGREALYLSVNLLWGQKELIAEWIAANSGKRVAKLFAQIAVKQLLGIWGRAEAAAFFAERAPFYTAWTLYAGKTDSIIICQIGGTFAECVERIDVAPSAPRISAGGSVQLSARVLGVAGSDLTAQREVTWSSADAGIATVDESGMVVATSRGGQVTISAASGGKVGSALVTVTPAVTGDSVEINPRVTTLMVGDSVTLTATIRNADGTVLRGRQVTWTTSDGTAMRLSRTTGTTVTVRGIATRPTATITATAEGTQAYAVVTVSDVPAHVSEVMISPGSWVMRAGESVTFYATVRDYNGAIGTRQSITWRTSDNNGIDGAMSISSTTGPSTTGTARRSGTDAAVAAVEYVSARSDVLIYTPGYYAPNYTNVASVSVSPSTVNLMVGESIEIHATARDAAGNLLNDPRALVIPPFRWSNSDAAKLVIRPRALGVLTAKAVAADRGGNTVTLIVNVDGVMASVNVNVMLPPD